MSTITNRFFSVVLAALFIIGATGCQKTQEKKVEDAKEDVATEQQKVEETNKQYAAEWANYQTEYQTKIAENKKDLADARARLKLVKAKNRKVIIEKDIAELEARNAELEQTMVTYQDEHSDSKWEKFKHGVGTRYDTVKSKIKKIFRDDD